MSDSKVYSPSNGFVAHAHVQSMRAYRELQERAARLELERDMFCLLFSTRDAHEGMHAFIDKRPPTFKGS